MSKILKDKVEGIITNYSRDFKNGEKEFYSFPCDIEGNLLDNNLESHKLYNNCLVRQLVYLGIKRWESRIYTPTVLECDCGEVIKLDSSKTICPKCGTIYRANGKPIKKKNLHLKEK